MELTKPEIERLLQSLCDATGQTPDSTGFAGMEEAFLQKGIQEISKRYLQDSILKPINSPGVESVGFQMIKLDAIATFLGFRNYLDYKQYADSQPERLPRQLQSLLGNYWSIVRCNSSLPDLLVSPIEISFKKGKLMAALTSPTRLFEGPVISIADNLYITISDQFHKQIHIVLKIGNAVSPKVLQGVFCGVNSAGVPIAGRELLVRQEVLPRDPQDTNRLPIAEAIQHPEWQAVGQYFAEYSRNNLKIRHVSRFDLTDLLVE